MSVLSKFTPWLIIFAMSLAACGKRHDGESAPYKAPPEPFPYLGSSASFAVLGGSYVSNAGSSIIYGDVGVYGASPSTITGFSGVKMTGGTIQGANGVSAKAQKDSEKAYNNLKNKKCDRDLTGQNLGGLTLTPGAYCFSEDARLDGLLTLDFQGNMHAAFVFQVGRNLYTANGSGVRMINNGESCNVFWQVPGDISLGSGSNLVGGFHAKGNITLQYGNMLNGKLSSQAGSIQIEASQIYNNFCPWPGAIM